MVCCCSLAVRTFRGSLQQPRIVLDKCTCQGIKSANTRTNTVRTSSGDENFQKVTRTKVANVGVRSPTRLIFIRFGAAPGTPIRDVVLSCRDMPPVAALRGMRGSSPRRAKRYRQWGSRPLSCPWPSHAANHERLKASQLPVARPHSFLNIDICQSPAASLDIISIPASQHPAVLCPCASFPHADRVLKCGALVQQGLIQVG